MQKWKVVFLLPVIILSGCFLTSDWSSDGKNVSYVQKDKANFYQLYVYNMEKDNVKQLTKDKIDSFAPKYSPNGNYIAYKTDSLEKIKKEIELFEPDGKYITGGKNKLWIMNIENLEKKFLVEFYAPEENIFLPVQWSTDSNFLFYVEERDKEFLLNSIDVSTRKVSTIFSSKTKVQFIVSPQKLVVLSDGIWVINPDGTGKEQISQYPSPEQQEEIFLIGWSKDYNDILYGIQTTGDSINILNLKTKQSREIFETSETIYYPEYSPLTDTIFWFSESPLKDIYDLWEVDLAGNINEKISNIPLYYKDVGTIPSWSKDYKKVFYYSLLNEKDKKLYPWTLDIASGEKRFIGTKAQQKQLKDKIESYKEKERGRMVFKSLHDEMISSGGKRTFLGTVVSTWMEHPVLPPQSGQISYNVLDYKLSGYTEGGGTGLNLWPPPEEKFVGKQVFIQGKLKKAELPLFTHPGEKKKKKEEKGIFPVKYIELEKFEEKNFFEVAKKEVNEEAVELTLKFTNPFDRALENITFYFFPGPNCKPIGETGFRFDRVGQRETKQILLKCSPDRMDSKYYGIVWGFTGKKDVLLIIDIP